LPRAKNGLLVAFISAGEGKAQKGDERATQNPLRHSKPWRWLTSARAANLKALKAACRQTLLALGLNPRSAGRALG